MSLNFGRQRATTSRRFEQSLVKTRHAKPQIQVCVVLWAMLSTHTPCTHRCSVREEHITLFVHVMSAYMVFNIRLHLFNVLKKVADGRSRVLLQVAINLLMLFDKLVEEEAEEQDVAGFIDNITGATLF